MRSKTLITLTAAIGLGSTAMAWAATSDTYRQLNLFGDVFERVRSDYVEEIKDSDLIEAAINGMLRSLDPHSGYLNAETLKDMREQTRGEFGGLGIEVTMENGVVKVVTPIDDTPADRAGIKAGDYITHLDGESIVGMSLSEAVEKMRGPVNSELLLTVRRAGEEQALEITIVRDIIKVQSVRGGAEGNAIYVRITSFNEKTLSGLEKQIESQRNTLGEGFDGVVLDLRNNPGGLLDQAVSVSDAFLDQGEIVSTRGRRADDTQRYNAKPGDLAEGKPIIVLMNGGSASASEIVAGALQDHRRAVVLGTKSFGKGSVQTIIPLQGNAAIRLTTARYYTPAGRSIQALGIDPDVKVEQEQISENGEGKAGRSEADLRGHLSAEENGEEKEDKNGLSERAKKDYQLRYALNLLNSMSILNKRLQPN